MNPGSWLLDTHALLWLLYDDPRLSKNVIELSESEAPLYYSVVAFWEISLKRSRAGFDFQIEDNWDKLLPPALESSGILRIDIEAEDCRYCEDLPLHHRDPFDRLMIAQCQTRHLGAITRDAQWKQYDITCLW